VATAILSVSTPGTTFLPAAADAAALAGDLNDYSADLVAALPDRFGFFAFPGSAQHRPFGDRVLKPFATPRAGW
jgi:hypothetical protein